MLVNLCLVLQFVISEMDYRGVDNFTVLPCPGVREPHSDTSQKAARHTHNEQIDEDAQRYILKSLFGYKLQDIELADENDLRLRVKSPMAKVSRTLANRLDPSLKDYFEHIPRHPKPVTIVNLRKKLQKYPGPTNSNVTVTELPSHIFYFGDTEDNINK